MRGPHIDVSPPERVPFDTRRSVPTETIRSSTEILLRQISHSTTECCRPHEAPRVDPGEHGRSSHEIEWARVEPSVGGKTGFRGRPFRPRTESDRSALERRDAVPATSRSLDSGAQCGTVNRRGTRRTARSGNRSSRRWPARARRRAPAGPARGPARSRRPRACRGRRYPSGAPRGRPRGRAS